MACLHLGRVYHSCASLFASSIDIPVIHKEDVLLALNRMGNVAEGRHNRVECDDGVKSRRLFGNASSLTAFAAAFSVAILDASRYSPRA